MRGKITVKMSLPGNTLPMASSDHQSSPEHPSGGKRQDIKTTPTHKVGITTPPSPGVIGQPRLPMASGAGSNTIAATDLLAHLPGGPAAMPKSFKDAAQKSPRPQEWWGNTTTSQSPSGR